MFNRIYIAIIYLSNMTFFASRNAINIVMSNDDGWAVAQHRALYSALKSVGHRVIVSSPAVNQSGAGSKSREPTPLETPCQFNTCPVGSPPFGSDPQDPNINYVNAYPVDAVKHGIHTLAPSKWGSWPSLVVTGPNVGPNLGKWVLYSGTIGAACYASLAGIPAIAFSGSYLQGDVPYTTLADPTLQSTRAANIYSALAVKFTDAFLRNPDYLPPGIVLNVNFAAITSCPAPGSYKFVLTRISTTPGQDVKTCGMNHLTPEEIAIQEGCIATVSVMDANTKGDASAAAQAAILHKLSSILECL